MLTRDLDFELPERFIAQTPTEPRDAARLLVLQRENGALTHRHVRDLPDLLREGDLLVFNDTRVLRARLRGFKILPDSSTGARVEALLLRERGRNRWECLLKPSARLREGGRVRFENDKFANDKFANDEFANDEFANDEFVVEARLLKRERETWEIEFEGERDVREILPQIGEVPLPPYIRASAPEERYQTTFSTQERQSAAALDSAAAPTAGLHFTPELLENLRSRGIETTFLTLAVGLGTFRPVQVENLDDHEMHREEFWIGPDAARRINAAKRENRRVVAVGTTSVRALESAALQNAAPENEVVREGEGETALFLKPGACFHVVDALLTNFHLPRSTLLALVAAFIEANGENCSIEKENGPSSGLATLRHAYRVAMENEYRFFSFGDAMLIE